MVRRDQRQSTQAVGSRGKRLPPDDERCNTEICGSTHDQALEAIRSCGEEVRRLNAVVEQVSSAVLVQPPPALQPKDSNLRNSLRFPHMFTKENPRSLGEMYTIDQKPLGQGSFGRVYKGVDKSTGAVRAIKSIELAKVSDAEQLEMEVSIQQSLDHPNIVKLFEVFKSDEYLHLAMEVCDGGELFDVVSEQGCLSERDTTTYVNQMLAAISYLHSQYIVHRDIKPENFLLQSKSKDAPIKIIDFGTAKRYEPGSDYMMKTKMGTLYYIAPQVLRGSYNEKCDIWSCGVIAYVLMCGFFPFSGGSDNDTLRHVLAGSFDFPSPEWDHISIEAKGFLRSLLTFDPDERPSAREALLHRWLQEYAPRSDSATVLPDDLGVRLRQFRRATKMKRVVLTLIGQQLQHDDLKDLRRMFCVLDRSRVGALSAQEILDGMEQHGISIPPHADEVLRNLDTNGSGKINYCEFVAATIPAERYLKRDVLWAAFCAFDRDGDGKISWDELASMVEGEDDDSEDLVDTLLAEGDVDKDGSISFDDFCAVLREQGSPEAAQGADQKKTEAPAAEARAADGQAAAGSLAERLKEQLRARLAKELAAAVAAPTAELREAAREVQAWGGTGA
eukprot:CAMPEP_0179203842 /NCGR_PEP_ID=MMETSP0796-20121207/101613_1 /TAXON_ID=73915 /ORGANISM="Pyrodinium bahamense, Strain pbaha01" /LENGTH=616 /DNA_ID=CAMNT_0020908715 /DNA_START=153 /DNA_END=1999 /DNA_ORIENTATION=-